MVVARGKWWVSACDDDDGDGKGVLPEYGSQRVSWSCGGNGCQCGGCEKAGDLIEMYHGGMLALVCECASLLCQGLVRCDGLPS